MSHAAMPLLYYSYLYDDYLEEKQQRDIPKPVTLMLQLSRLEHEAAYCSLSSRFMVTRSHIMI